MTGLRTRDNAQNDSNERVKKLNKEIDTNIQSVEESLAELDEYLNSCIEVLSERMLSSTDVGHALALFRAIDNKMEVNKKRTDLIKLRISDKSTELGVQKKPGNVQSIDDILAGVQTAAALGAAAGGAAGAVRATKELAVTEPDVIIVDNDNPEVEVIDITSQQEEPDVESLVTVQKPKK